MDAINLRELKQKPMPELLAMAKELAIENAPGLRKQELIFSLLQAHSARKGEVTAEGVLECLPDGFGGSINLTTAAAIVLYAASRGYPLPPDP